MAQLPQWITDKYGKRYSLKISRFNDSAFTIFAQDGDCRAGTLALQLCYPYLRIADLHIEDDFIAPPRFKVIRKWRTILQLPPRKCTLRGRGLGAALLRIAIDYAKAQSCEGVDGELAPNDLERTPYLRDFYRKAGFEIQRKDNKETLLLRLKPNS
jgi:GNAT superfamily N-acetyltransferase